MAKQSMIKREEKREYLITKYAKKRGALKEILSKTSSYQEKLVTLKKFLPSVRLPNAVFNKFSDIVPKLDTEACLSLVSISLDQFRLLNWPIIRLSLIKLLILQSSFIKL